MKSNFINEFELAFLLKFKLNGSNFSEKFLRTNLSFAAQFKEVLTFFDKIVRDYSFKLEFNFYDKAYQVLRESDRWFPSKHFLLNEEGQANNQKDNYNNSWNIITKETGKNYKNGIELLKKMSIDNGLSQYLSNRIESWQAVNQIGKNYQAGRSLLHDLDLKEPVSDYLQERLSITVITNNSTKEKIAKFINDYIDKYRKNDLEDLMVYNYQKHLANFVLALKNYDGVSSNFLEIKKDLLIKNPEKKPVINYNFSKTNEKDDNNNPEWCFLEFLLLIEQKKYISIKTIDFDYKSILNQNNQNNWTIGFELLRNIEEIVSIEGNWTIFGDIKLRKDTGYVVNGELADFKFDKDKPAFKALCLLVENPEKKFSLEDLQEELLQEKDLIKDNKNRRKIMSQINNIINNQIRKPLKMNKANSNIDIFCIDNYFFLTAIPK